MSNEKVFASLLKGEGRVRRVSQPGESRTGELGITRLIRRFYEGKICAHADVEMLIERYPCELAYALALVDTTDHRSVTPGMGCFAIILKWNM